QPSIVFDRTVTRQSVSGVTLTANGVPVVYTPTFELGDSLVRLAPASILRPNTNYVLTIAGVKDGAGATVTSTVIAFTTGPTIDLAAPAYVAFSPTGVNIGTKPVIRLRASEPIDPVRSVGAYLLNSRAGKYVNGLVTRFSDDGRWITLEYPGRLDSFT